MTKRKTILVEEVDADVWKKTVAISKYKDMKVGHLLTEILFIFIEKQKLIKKGDKFGREHSRSKY